MPNCHHYYEFKKHRKLFYSCDGCKMNGHGPNYECRDCGKNLHEECWYARVRHYEDWHYKHRHYEDWHYKHRHYKPRIITHEYFGASSFTFQHKPYTIYNTNNNREEFMRCCDACGKDICGYSYHCETKKLDLHPCCRKLKKQLVLMDDEKSDRHDKAMMIFNLTPEKVNSKCAWCKKTKISGENNVPGWSYVSSCKNKYHFHVYCMSEILQEIAMEKVNSKGLRKSMTYGGGGSKIVKIIKLFLKVILAAFLGDPNMLISAVLLEFFT